MNTGAATAFFNHDMGSVQAPLTAKVLFVQDGSRQLLFTSDISSSAKSHRPSGGMVFTRFAVKIPIMDHPAYHQYKSCIDACLACAALCHHCAASCLQEDEVRMMARCIQLDMECAALCYASAQLMSLGSEEARRLCALCADLCAACAAECGQHDMKHCQECAEACRRCAAECRRMSA